MNVPHSGYSQAPPSQAPTYQDRPTFEWTERPGENLLSDPEWTAIKTHARLSMREGQVCRLLFEGNKRDEIAELLGISPRTVRYHLESLHKKLQVNTRLGLVLRMIQIRDFIVSKNSYERTARTNQFANQTRRSGY